MQDGVYDAFAEKLAANKRTRWGEGGSNALVVPQAPLVPGSAVTARTAAPQMEAGGKLRASSLAERRKLKLETGEGLRVPVAFECLG